MIPYSIAWWALIVALGGLGAASRYIVDTLLRERASTPPALATASINALGAIGIGVFSQFAFQHGVQIGPNAFTLGFLGGFTTYSTAMVDTLQLWQRGRRAAAIGNTLGQFVGCFALALAAFAVTGALTN